MITNPQTRLLAAATLLLITTLCCPSLLKRATPSAMTASATTSAPLTTATTSPPTPPTATTTPRPILALGEWVTWDGLSISIESYEVVDQCRGAGEGPAEGAKLLYVWASMRNDGEKVMQCPASLVTITYNGVFPNAAGGTVCRYDDQALGTDCCGRIYPDVECRGWGLWELPQAHQVESILVEVQPVPWPGQIATWRLDSGQ